jgi:hypothetical protein
VSCSLAVKCFVALLLPMTLAWKATIGLENSTELKERIVEFLAQQQFDVAITEDIVEDMPAIRASREACRMVILKTAPNGWRRHMISERTAPTDQVFIVFRGIVYTEQPTWLTLVAHLWSRFLRKVGLQRHTTPVIAVIAPASCDVERLPWYELRERGVL